MDDRDIVARQIGRAPRAFLRVAARWLAGRGRDEDLSELAARELSVESPRRRLDVAADGEVVRLRPPLRYVIHPGALAVVAPRAPPAPPRSGE